MSSSPWDIPALLKQIDANGQKIGKDSGLARLQCLDAARSLVCALETPTETVLRHAWAEPTQIATIRACIDLKVFERLSEGSGKAKTSSDLAVETGADPFLMEHLLKHLAATGTLFETGPNEYLPTPFSNALTIPVHRAGIQAVAGDLGPAFAIIPEFLARIQYKMPNNPSDTPFHDGLHTKDSFFAYLSQDSERLLSFQRHMEGKTIGWRTYLDDEDFVPNILINGAKEGEHAVFMVDVGGGKGHDLQKLALKYPNSPGKLVLQDLKGPIDEAKASNLDDQIVTMEYDFFNEQPIQGARAYFVKCIIHDWPDDQAIKILVRLREAVEVGYSKILLSERVIPAQGAHWTATSLDLIMMTLFGSRERTEAEWHKLLASAGLRIVRIWSFDPGAESLIEAEVA